MSEEERAKQMGKKGRRQRIWAAELHIRHFFTLNTKDHKNQMSFSYYLALERGGERRQGDRSC